ncbi:MAG: hypothetical protein ACLUUJ_09260 [Acutalibacteraceae bacterium]
MPDYARYLTRYLEEYENGDFGIGTHLQNEALFETCYPSCLVSPEQEAELAGCSGRKSGTACFYKSRWPCGCMITILPRPRRTSNGPESRCHGVVRRVCPARL